MRVAAVVVTFNRSDLLQRSLAAIEKQSYLPEKLFVIDNASTDSTPEILKSRQMKLPTAVHRLAKKTGGAGPNGYPLPQGVRRRGAGCH